MPESPNYARQAEPEVFADTSGSMIPFDFGVTWRLLSTPDGIRTSFQVYPPTRQPRIAKPAAHAPDSKAQKLEVKEVREVKKVAVVEAPPPPPIHVEAAPAAQNLPAFAQLTGQKSREQRLVPIVLALTLVVVAIGVWRYSAHSPAPQEVSSNVTEVGSVGWITEWASDPTGSALGRQISLYRPSVSMSDYRLEFTGRIGRQSLGWVFRAADSRNYYAAKLEANRLGDPMVLTRFAVIHGVEDRHSSKRLDLQSGAQMLKVKLETRASHFVIWVENQIVDDWNDDRLRTGGVGFFNQRDEWGQVGSLAISLLGGGVLP